MPQLQDPVASDLLADGERDELRRLLARLDPAEREALLAALLASFERKVALIRDEEAELLELTSAISTELKLDALLVRIMETVTRLLDAERATLFLYDAALEELWALAGEGSELSKIRFPARAGIAGHVFGTGETVNIEDAYADPRFNPELDRRTGFTTRSILCMPVSSAEGRTIAVVQVLNKRGGSFGPLDERRLRAFSAQASIALERARLFEAFLEKERIEHGLRLAHEIQMGMLPQALPDGGRFELWAELRPARSVGGDLYDFRRDGERLFFLIGDVSGKGVGAALFMAVTMALMRAVVPEEPSLARALARVNRELSRDNERALFVTVFAGWLDLASGEVVYVNAGHNLPYRLGRDGVSREVQGGRGIALGVVGGYEFEAASLRLEPGETLFLYTDGVPEAHDTGLQAFGLARLQAQLEAYAGRPPRLLTDGLLETLASFTSGTPQFDDVAVLAIRYLGSGSFTAPSGPGSR